jgi:hypothetical protein
METRMAKLEEKLAALGSNPEPATKSTARQAKS